MPALSKLLPDLEKRLGYFVFPAALYLVWFLTLVGLFRSPILSSPIFGVIPTAMVGYKVFDAWSANRKRKHLKHLFWIVAAAVLSFIILTSFVSATIIMSEDFENWNSNGWTVYGSPQIIAEAARTGSYGMRILSTAADDRDFIYKSMTETDTLTVIAYIRFNSLTIAGITHYEIIYIDTSAAVAQMMFEFSEVDDTPWLTYTGLVSYGDIMAIEYDHWYKVKIALDRDPTSGTEKIWIDDVLKVDNTGDTDAGGAMNYYYFGMIEFPASGDNFSFDFDDITIDDELPHPAWTETTTTTSTYTSTSTSSSITTLSVTTTTLTTGSVTETITSTSITTLSVTTTTPTTYTATSTQTTTQTWVSTTSSVRTSLTIRRTLGSTTTRTVTFTTNTVYCTTWTWTVPSSTTRTDTQTKTTWQTTATTITKIGGASVTTGFTWTSYGYTTIMSSSTTTKQQTDTATVTSQVTTTTLTTTTGGTSTFTETDLTTEAVTTTTLTTATGQTSTATETGTETWVIIIEGDPTTTTTAYTSTTTLTTTCETSILTSETTTTTCETSISTILSTTTTETTSTLILTSITTTETTETETSITTSITTTTVEISTSTSLTTTTDTETVGSTSTTTTTISAGNTTITETVTLTTTSVAYDLNIINVPGSVSHSDIYVALNPTFEIFNNGPLSQDCTLKFWVLDPNGVTVYNKERTVFTPAYAETDVPESFSFVSPSDGSHKLYAEILTLYTPHPSALQQFNVISVFEPILPPLPAKQCALVVHVIDLFGMNAPDLPIEIVRISDGKVMAKLTTGSSGLTDMVKLPKGVYTVDVYKDGVLQLSSTLTLEEDTSIQLQIGIPIILTFARMIIILLIVIIVILLLFIRRQHKKK